MILAMILTAADVDPALLKALADHDERMEKFLDAHEVTIDAVVRELDGDGKLLKKTSSKLKQKRVNGKLKTTVISADDVAEEQKQADERDEKNERTESPFAARNQSKYHFKSLGPGQIGFEPKGEKTDRVFGGVAVVDPKAGEVVTITMTPAKLPMFADEMRVELAYENHTASGRNISRFMMVGAGGILFIKRRGDLTMTFTFGRE